MKGLVHKNYKDVFRGVRYGLSLKKAIAIYGLLILPGWVLWLLFRNPWWLLILLVPYFFLKIAISKMVFEQLKGDDFYPLDKSMKFALRNFKHYLAFFIVDVVLIAFFYLLFVLIAFLGKVNFIVGALLLPIALFVFAFILYLVIALIMSESVGISAIATQEYDAFDTLYESLSMFNSQVYRFVAYKTINMIQSYLTAIVIGGVIYLGYLAWISITGWGLDELIFYVVLSFAYSFKLSVWFATDLIAYLVMVYKRDGVDLSKGLPEALQNMKSEG